MKTTKQQLVEEFLREPIKAGDWISVKGLSYDKEKVSTCVVDSIDNGVIVVKELSGNGKNTYKIKQEQILEKNAYNIGYNPFKENRSRLRMVAFSLESILHAIGFESRKKTFKTEKFGDVIVPELNWNPTMKDKNGKQTPYQRGFVWSLKDKQLLIESVYQGLDIGKVVIKKNKWEYVESQVKLGNFVAFKDVVDGKQRLNALIEFVEDKFDDLNGNTFSNLSNKAQHKFFDFSSISYGELDEETTDEEIQETFLKINFTGVQMSQEHIDYVKSLEIKKD